MAEYGWKLEDVWKLTMREVDWILKSMLNRQNWNRKFNASLHDKKIEIPEFKKEKLKPIELTKEQEEAAAFAIEQAKLRKAKEYGSRR